jgi:TonB family protein
MLDLPILNVRLHACAEDWQQMTPTARGRHCAACHKTVVDFTHATQADLEAALTGSRICGRFTPKQLTPNQLAPLPRRTALRPKLRRFLVALVLVCGLGLTSGQARAQVRKAAAAARPRSAASGRKTPHPSRPAVKAPLSTTVTVVSRDVQGIVGEEPQPRETVQSKVYAYVEQMPVYQDGGQEGALQFIKQNLRWPREAADVEGRVFVSFIVDASGRLREFAVLKGIHPALDAEALRVVRLLDGRYLPGKQNGRTVDVRYIVPVTFSRK